MVRLHLGQRYDQVGAQGCVGQIDFPAIREALNRTDIVAVKVGKERIELGDL